MDLLVTDHAIVNIIAGTVEIHRSFSLAPGTTAWPHLLRFTVPRDASLAEATCAFGSERASLNQCQVSITPPQEFDVSSAIAITISVPIIRKGKTYSMATPSLLIGVRSYDLDLRFPESLDVNSWAPGRLLKTAALSEGNRAVTLRYESPECSPFDADLAATFAFTAPVHSEDAIVGMLSEMPVLNWLASQDDAVFQSHGLILLLHFLEDLLPFVYSFERRGLQPSQTLLLFKDYPYGQFEIVRSTLHRRGYHVEGPVTDGTTLNELAGLVGPFCGKCTSPLIVIEDGGYLLPAFHRAPQLQPFLPRIKGVVEQTTNGAWKANEVLAEREQQTKERRLGTVLLNVAQSEVKLHYEPRFVAEAACHNIVSLRSGMSWAGVRAIVLGYGTIGRSIVDYVHRNGAQVGVVDPSPLRQVLASQDHAIAVGGKIGPILAAFDKHHTVQRDYIIIGTTGRRSVTREDIDLIAPYAPILVSVSSKQIEFDLDGFRSRPGASITEFRQGGRRVGTTFKYDNLGEITVLADGYPVNFYAASSVPNQQIDPIMALLHACAAELASPRVLLDPNAGSPGQRDATFCALPWSRISHEIISKIVDDVQLFAPMLNENQHTQQPALPK